MADTADIGRHFLLCIPKLLHPLQEFEVVLHLAAFELLNGHWFVNLVLLELLLQDLEIAFEGDHI